MQIISVLQKTETVIARLSCIYMFIVRLWISNIFFKSGRARLDDWFAGHWDNEIYLFTFEHPVPLLPPAFAAVMSTFFELVCPVLLVVGLFSRLASLPLFFMTLMIIITYDDNIQHFYWMFLLAAIFFYGPGRISADYLIKRKWLG